MSELLSVNKPQEMSTSIVNEDIDESWFKNADNLMFDDDINLDYKLSSAEDVEFFKLLEEVDSLKYTEKINGQQEEQEKQQQPQQSNESFSRDLEGEISETFPNNEDIIVLEDDELIDSDNIDNGVILKDEENESDLYFGKRSPQKESDLPNSGQSRCILEYEGQKNHIYVKSNKYVGEFMQDLKDDLIPDKIHDCEVVLTFLDENIDDFRLVLTQDNKYSQEFTLGKIITVHDKYRKSHDLNTAYLHVVMTLQDRFISQYKKYDDVIGGRAQNPIVVGDSSPESFDDGDNILSKSPVEDIITKIDQASGTGNSFFNPSKDASLPLAKDVNDEQFTDIREGNDDLPPYSGDEDDRSDGSIWDNDVHEFYDEDNHHQTQETYSEAEELYVGSYEDGIGLSDDVKHLDEQMEQNDLPSDKLSDLREDIFNEDSLNDINDFVENLDESSFYDQTFDNDKIIKSEIDTETSETNEQNTSKVSKEFEEDVDVETSEINEQNTSKVSKEFEEDVDAETSETNEQNTPKVLKELEEDVDDNIPSTTEFDDGKEYDFSSVYDSKENDLFAPIDDEWAAEYTASELDPTINDNEIIVSPGKRERPYTNDNEDTNKKARID